MKAAAEVDTENAYDILTTGADVFVVFPVLETQKRLY